MAARAWNQAKAEQVVELPAPKVVTDGEALCPECGNVVRLVDPPWNSGPKVLGSHRYDGKGSHRPETRCIGSHTPAPPST